jgi:NAD(P)-dependent dehydrogenase (short-subunit alcohol dehydrogenase family)
MRAQNYGCVVNVMSSAMLGIGAIAPYAAGKAGLFGLTRDAAIQGRENNICVHGVNPVSASRLSKGAPQEAWLNEHFPPHLAAEAITYLCSKECEASGDVFAIGGGRIARSAFFTGHGFRDEALTAESVAAHIQEARNLDGARLLNSADDDMAAYDKPST